MAEGSAIALGLYALLILIPFVFPLISWALGRWYQGTLLMALNEEEKRLGSMLQNAEQSSTCLLYTSDAADD